MFHQHFNTPEGGGAIRSYYLATALVQHGHHVTVITSHSGRERCEKTIEGVHIIYLLFLTITDSLFTPGLGLSCGLSLMPSLQRPPIERTTMHMVFQRPYRGPMHALDEVPVWYAVSL